MYEITESFDGIKTIKRTNEDGSLTFIPIDEANTDYQAYLESLKANADKL